MWSGLLLGFGGLGAYLVFSPGGIGGVIGSEVDVGRAISKMNQGCSASVEDLV